MMNKILLGLMLLLSASTTVSAQERALDKSVRTGKLDNGFTYYIRHNDMPKERAFFYLVQRVGSYQEESNQRGLAHFLEHMCFNGTKHFPGHSLITFLERHGIGSDNFNANTDCTYTYYNINNVPTDQGVEVLDSILLIMEDWSHGLTLDPKEIDAERNVIVEEWRARNVDRQRLIYNAVPAVLAGSKLAECLPIGDMNIIRNFRPKQLADYYDKWYNPENQAIIVVGNVDVDRTENEIRRRFSALRSSKNAGKVVEATIPDNQEPIVVIEKDKELTNEEIFIFRKLAPTDIEERKTMNYRKRFLMRNFISHMLGIRAKALSSRTESAAKSIEVDFGQYFIAKEREAFSVHVEPKAGRATEAFEEAMTMLRQTAEHGFTDAECMQAAQWFEGELQRRMAISNQYNSLAIGNALIDYHLLGHVFTEDTIGVNVDRQILEKLTFNDVNNYASEMLYTLDNSNLAVVNFNKEDAGKKTPTKDDFLAAMQYVADTKTEAYVYEGGRTMLMSEAPIPGEIVSMQDTLYGAQLVTMKNGMRLFIAHSDNVAGEIVMKAWAPGGTGTLKNNHPLLQMFASSGIAQSKIGGLSRAEIESINYGRKIETEWNVNQDEISFVAASSPQEFENVLQQFYLTMTSLEPDQEAFDNRRSEVIEQMEAMTNAPNVIFQDSINTVSLDKTSAVWMITPKSEEIRNFNYADAVESYKQLLSDAGAFNVIIIGQYDVNDIARLVNLYLASIPGTSTEAYDRNVQNVRLCRTLKEKDYHVDFKLPMNMPQTQVSRIWMTNDKELTIEQLVMQDIVQGIFQKMQFTKIREELGASYSPSSSTINLCSYNTKPLLGMQCILTLKPEQADVALHLVEQIMSDIATKIDPALLSSTQEELTQAMMTATGTNTAWASWIEQKIKYNINYPEEYIATLKAQTPETVSAYVRNLLKTCRNFSVVMRPE